MKKAETDGGGLPCTVANGATGLLCEPGDTDDLAEKLAELLDDAELRQRLGLAGRRRFEEEFAWGVVIDKHYLHLPVKTDATKRRMQLLLDV